MLAPSVEVASVTDWLDANVPSAGVNAGAATVSSGFFGVEGQFMRIIERPTIAAQRINRAMAASLMDILPPRRERCATDG